MTQHSPEIINEWELATNNLHRLSRVQYDVAVLPTGAVEAHNRHLPQGQDVFHTTEVARQACRRAWEKSPNIVLLPTIPYGVDCNLMKFPLTTTISQATLDALVKDIIVSMRTHNIQKIVIINGHGGNDFTPLVRQIQSEMDIHVFVCDWWKVGQDQYHTIFDNPDDHAGEMETSIAMALYPQLIEPDVAGDGKAKPFRFEALRQGWVRTSRDFSKLNDHCAVGDPAQASAEKGQHYLELVVPRISQFLTELAQSPIDDSFPFSNS